MQIAFVVWASGVVFCAAMAIRRFHMIRRNLLQDTRPVNADIEKWFIDLSHELALQIGLGSAPQVRVKYGYASPVLVGILKPIVIVPAELLAITKRTQLRHALLHEFAHIKRHDLIWNSLCVFVQIIYWYHPLADRFSFGAAGLFSSRSQLIARLDWLHRPVGTTKCVVAV
jgi:bla regulator protein BlaR1